MRKSSGWAFAIQEAQRQIKEAQEKIAKLTASIQTIEEMRDAGEPFLSGEPRRRKRKTAKA